MRERCAGETKLAGGAHGSAAGRAASGLSGDAVVLTGWDAGCASGAHEFGPARIRLGRGCAGVGWTGWEAGCWAGFSSASWAARLGGEGGLGWFLGFGPA